MLFFHRSPDEKDDRSDKDEEHEPLHPYQCSPAIIAELVHHAGNGRPDA